jgi:2-polyprenyl-3-methyl-5-hydroxy-6-metoxy-1,4-benzoquinol methylase
MTTGHITRKMVDWLTHFIGKASGRYFFEDFIRVYPDRVVYNRFGLKRKITEDDVNNYLNHLKVYQFAAQFVEGKIVADIGCGSGYGCEILARHGAKKVFGCDISTHAIQFARQSYGAVAQFSKQGITDLRDYSDSAFDVTINSEVLEHIKEYGLEGKAIKELKRVTRRGGIVMVGTPNSELLGDHGFSFDEIHALFASNFDTFTIFENALVPRGPQRQNWEERRRQGRTGVIVSELINLKETVLPENTVAELKIGLEPGSYRFSDIEINTTLLHNTHSWLVIARK